MDAFDASGYLVFEGLLNDDLCEPVRADVDQMMVDRDAGVLWGAYAQVAQINEKALEMGHGPGGRYDFLFDSRQFFDRTHYIDRLNQVNQGSLTLKI
ncbi:MAG: hypothetical protein O3B73_16310 [bacterium]|nr:hypothetical protein [bacterium]